ncbi:heavy-metal-associated domain-containing protein [Candidatus Bathyarchaeota archaeon]|nr:heavy-metal-associated domain-containing protein [Candidatus Bathyarchaeota archaeon]
MKQTVFAVPMKCGDCAKHVSDTLHELGGITKVEPNLEDQLVLVEGTGMEVRGYGGL